MSRHGGGMRVGRVPVSQRTRPIRSAMTVGPTLCWIIAVIWVFDFADYQIFTVSAAIPLAVASLGLLVLQGWAREISLATAGLWGTALYWFGYLERPDNLGKGIPWVFAALITIGAVTALMVGIAAAGM